MSDQPTQAEELAAFHAADAAATEFVTRYPVGVSVPIPKSHEAIRCRDCGEAAEVRIRTQNPDGNVVKPDWCLPCRAIWLMLNDKPRVMARLDVMARADAEKRGS